MSSAAIFDMDGLLIDSEPLWRQAEISCFAEVGVHLTEQDCRGTMGYRLNEVIDHWYHRSPWERITKEALEEFIIGSVIELIKTKGKALEGVEEALDLFSRMNFRIALASSSPHRLIKEVLGALDLANHFEVVHSAENEVLGKPHPQVFLTTADLLGVAPENCVVIEDSFHGVIAGKAAKMKVIAVPDAHDRQLPGFGAADVVLPSLKKLSSDHIKALFENRLPTTSK